MTNIVVWMSIFMYFYSFLDFPLKSRVLLKCCAKQQKFGLLCKMDYFQIFPCFWETKIYCPNTKSRHRSLFPLKILSWYLPPCRDVITHPQANVCKCSMFQWDRVHQKMHYLQFPLSYLVKPVLILILILILQKSIRYVQKWTKSPSYEFLLHIIFESRWSCNVAAFKNCNYWWQKTRFSKHLLLYLLLTI